MPPNRAGVARYHFGDCTTDYLLGLSSDSGTNERLADATATDAARNTELKSRHKDYRYDLYGEARDLTPDEQLEALELIKELKRRRVDG